MTRLILSAAFTAAFIVSAQARDDLARGKYLATIMDCAGCHTPGIFSGKPDFGKTLGGSEIGFQIPGLGIFYPPNLTPDEKTGIGSWTKQDIVTAIRTGVRPDGRILAPIMPWKSYSALTDADAQALAAYLKSLKSVEHQVPAMIGATEKPSAPYLSVAAP
jgi:mono/diheme cytochrome c family protein